MNFYRYRSLLDIARKTSHVTFGDMSPVNFYLTNRQYLIQHGDGADWSMHTRMIEFPWYQKSRPYYKLWPSIIPALLKTRLDIPLSVAVGTNDVISLRLPEGYAIREMPGATASLHQWGKKPNGVALFVCSQRGDLYQSVVIPYSDSRWSIEDLSMQRVNNSGRLNSDADACAWAFLRLALAVRLLETDPTVMQPDVLSDDRARFDATTDPELKQHLIDKAHKRGIVGWRIGEAYEVCPHYRRPHFALRHTGKGGTIPRIVPVLGCIVHRQRATDVPTGVFGPNGEEIEPVPKS